MHERLPARVRHQDSGLLHVDFAGRYYWWRSLAQAVLLIAAALAAGFATPAFGAHRSAVVLANSSYGGLVLPTAAADGDLVAKTLRESMFDVLLIQDLNTQDLATTARSITQHVQDSDLSILYFAGVQAASGGDVILEPVDGKVSKQTSGLALGALVAAIRKTSKSTIIVLDGVPVSALRDTPGAQAIKPEHLQMPPDNGGQRLLVSYSGAAGMPTANDNAGPNGIFATIFANVVAQPGIPAQQVFRELRRNVREATRGAQLPSTEGDLPDDVVLHPAVEDPITSQPRPSLDEIFWTLIKRSADGADFRLFATTFPSSSLAERAAARQIALTNSTATDVGSLVQTIAFRKAALATHARSDQQSLALGASIDRVPPIEIRTWPGSLPKTPQGLATLAKGCDEVAGDPDDPMRLTPGIQWGLVNLRIAIRTCLVDLAHAPKDRRLLYQVGRLLDMMGFTAWAESFYREAANLGYSAAYANLAYLYMTGRGRPVDMASAIPYLKLGAELGNPRCRTDLGFNYLKGFGVDRSPAEALLWLRLAAASGWPNALDILANMYLDGDGVAADPGTATRLFEAAAWVGNTNAMSSLGRRYLAGSGVDRDPDTARLWFERSIAVGNAFAPLYLGIMYRDGDGVTRDYVKAASFIRLSAERGFGEARLRFGELYEAGKGVPRDPETAAFNYTLTERQSFEHPVNAEFIALAKQRLNDLLAKLTSEQQAAVERRVAEYIKLNGS